MRGITRERIAARVTPFRRLLWPLTLAALFVAATVATIRPRNLAWGRAVIGSRIYQHTMGDAIQLTYYLWLWRHALVTRSHLPWVDPFQFAATGHMTTQPFGWPLVIVWLPVEAIAGPFAAYNVLLLASFSAAGVATYLWIRAIGASRWAATVGGFAFAFAPWMLSQVSHLDQLLAFLVPLCFLFAERALRGPPHRARRAGWGFAITYLCLAGSGEMHLVLFVTPALAAYAVIRARGSTDGRLRSLVWPALVTVVGAGLLVGATYTFVLGRSERSVAVPFTTVQSKAPRLSDLGRRWLDQEHTAYPGVVVGSMAVVGTVASLRKRKRRTITLTFVSLGVAAYALALAPSLDHRIVRLYRAIPLLGFVKVPGRVLIVAVLSLALLAAFAVDVVPAKAAALRAAVALAVIALLMLDSSIARLDLQRTPVEPSALQALPENAAVLDIPPQSYRNVTGSTYEIQIMDHPGPHAGGYSVFVTPEAHVQQQRTQPLGNLPIEPCRWLDVARDVHFDYVVVYTGLFGPEPLQRRGDGEAFVSALNDTPGFRPLDRVDDMAVFRFEPQALRCVGTGGS